MKTILLQNTGEELTDKELKNKLKNGLILHFDNNQFCDEFQSDDLRGGRIELKKCFGRFEFITWFNGSINHSSKGLTSCLKNLQRLCDKFGCKTTEINDEL